MRPLNHGDNNDKKISILIFILIIVTSLFQVQCSRSNADSKDGNGKSVADNDTSAARKAGKDRPKEELVPVETVALKTGTISAYLSLSSNLETEKMVDVYSRVPGLVQKIYVEEGDYVEKGQVLMELETDEYKLAEARALVNFEQQQSTFE